MAKRDRYSRIADRIIAQRERLSKKIEELSPVGFGKTAYTRSEMRDKLAKDASLRETMAAQMGPGLFLDYAQSVGMEGTDGPVR